MSPSTEPLYYAYGLVAAERSLVGAPAGVDGRPVELIAEGAAAALVTGVDRARYAPEAVEPALADVQWLAPRAAAHDDVLLWATDASAVVPLPMFTLFSDPAAVRTMLRERAAEVLPLLERLGRVHEYGVRIFRDAAVLDEHLAELSPRVAALAEQVRGASPGQRYLLERKAAAERARERDRAAAEVARYAMSALAPHAVAALREPVPLAPARDQGESGAVLNAYFLISREHPEPFRAALTAFAQRHEPLGFRVHFTGPWPPYHFARGDR